MKKDDPSLDSLTCSEMVNHLLSDFPAPGSLYYVLVNGLYLGEYGDYASCRVSTTNGNYVLANVQGTYTGSYPFTRGTFGKYQNFSP